MDADPVTWHIMAFSVQINFMAQFRLTSWHQGWRALVFGEGLRLGLRLSQYFSGSQALGLRLRLSHKKHYVLKATLSTHESYLYS
jgi:hypothetical protein